MMFDVSSVPGTGELTCTAQNSIGDMDSPCVWQIKETGTQYTRSIFTDN